MITQSTTCTTQAAFPVPSARAARPAGKRAVCRLCGERLHQSLFDVVPGTSGLPACEPSPKLELCVCGNCELLQPLYPFTDRAGPRLKLHSIDSMQRCHQREAAARARYHLFDDDQRTGSEAVTGESARSPRPGYPATAAPAKAAFNLEDAMEMVVRDGCVGLIGINHQFSRIVNPFEFAAGCACLLRPNGVAMLQLPNLRPQLEAGLFDAFRPGEQFYMSLAVAERMMQAVRLRVFDGEAIPDDGGSFLIYACHRNGPHKIQPAVKALRDTEGDMRQAAAGFARKVDVRQDEIRAFALAARAAGRRIIAFGAVDRGEALLNGCGLTCAEIACIAEPEARLQGIILPGCNIPVVSPAAAAGERPDDIVILDWPNASEVLPMLGPLRLSGIRVWKLLPEIMRIA